MRTEHLDRQLVLASRLWASANPHRPIPFPTEAWKYNSMLTYIPVSFLSGFVFFQKLCSGYG